MTGLVMSTTTLAVQLVTVLRDDRLRGVVVDREGCQNPVPSGCRSVVLVHQAAEPIPTVHRRTGNWTRVRRDRLRGTSAERAVRPLTVVVLNEHAQDPLDTAEGPEGQRLRRALRRHGPARVPRLDLDLRSSPARAHAPPTSSTTTAIDPIEALASSRHSPDRYYGSLLQITPVESADGTDWEG